MSKVTAQTVTILPESPVNGISMKDVAQPSIIESIKPATNKLKRSRDENDLPDPEIETSAKKGKTNHAQEEQKVQDLKRSEEVIKATNELLRVEKIEEEEDDDEEETSSESGREAISEEVQGRIDYIDGLVSGLSKTFLKMVMKQMGCYGGGTNRDMAEAIVDHVTSSAENGCDLVDEKNIVRRVHRECWGSCGYEEDEEGEDNW